MASNCKKQNKKNNADWWWSKTRHCVETGAAANSKSGYDNGQGSKEKYCPQSYVQEKPTNDSQYKHRTRNQRCRCTGKIRHHCTHHAGTNTMGIITINHPLTMTLLLRLPRIQSWRGLVFYKAFSNNQCGGAEHIKEGLTPEATEAHRGSEPAPTSCKSNPCDIPEESLFKEGAIRIQILIGVAIRFETAYLHCHHIAIE